MASGIKIAIDGPAASGKSTTARRLAQKLGYIYIDTGAMYRAATLAVLQENVDIHNEQAVLACVKKHRISIQAQADGQHTFLDDQDVTHLLRSSAINRTISLISSYPEVRRVMVEQQRRLAQKGGVVMDGRDIGTVVLPDADLKVFMVASIKERARRRLAELKEQGEQVTLDQVEEEIRRRDRLDATRSEAPLKKAEDARELDTSRLTIDQQVEIIYNWAKEIIAKNR